MERANKVAERFSSRDVLIFRGWPDLKLLYFSRLRVIGMLSIYMMRPEGESTYDGLVLLVEAARSAGGAVYVDAPTDGEPWIDPYFVKAANLDFTPDLYETVRWGRTVRVAGHEFREIADLPERAPPR